MSEKLELEIKKRAIALQRAIETATCESYNDLTEAVNAAIDGYGQGDTPDKGFIAETWDSDGYVLTGVIKNLAEIPPAYFQCRNSSEGYFKNLTNVTFSGATPTKFSDRCFQGCVKLSLDFPSTLTIIGGYCFEANHCIDLRTLKEGLVSIGANAFMNCRQNGERTNIRIPSTVKTMDSQCFYRCYLTSVRFLGTPDSIANNVFNSNGDLLDIYVPWAEGEVANAPFGATSATIHYNTTYDENGNPIVAEV